MSVLRNFERGLEGMVEGAFAKTFRSGLQPVELAKRVLRDMEAGKTLGVRDQTWVPNRYAFTLSPPDADRFLGAQAALVSELSQVVRAGARERGWSLMGPPQIVFDVDPKLKKGAIRCHASIVEGVDPGDPTEVGGPRLTLMTGDRHGGSYPLSHPVSTLGREPDCEIVLTDAAASRRHASITERGGEFVLSDLGSTNGTSVNGTPIRERALQDGDRITIGRTTFEFSGG